MVEAMLGEETWFAMLLSRDKGVEAVEDEEGDEGDIIAQAVAER